MNMSLKSFLSAILISGLVLSCKGSASPPTENPAAGLGGLTIAAGTRTDKGTGRHNYTEVYERFLFQLKDEPIRLFEIGIENGGSLEMWNDYFPKATVFGIDIEDKSKMQNARTKTFIADQSKRDQLQKFIDRFGGNFDVLIDDGGHTMDQQQISLGFLFKFVKPGGYYILEDIHTSLPALYTGYGVAPDGSNTTLAMIEKYVRGSPAKFESRYMLPEEKQYLDANVEFANLNFRNNPSHSIMCIFKKRQAN